MVKRKVTLSKKPSFPVWTSQCNHESPWGGWSLMLEIWDRSFANLVDGTPWATFDGTVQRGSSHGKYQTISR